MKSKYAEKTTSYLDDMEILETMVGRGKFDKDLFLAREAEAERNERISNFISNYINDTFYIG